MLKDFVHYLEHFLKELPVLGLQDLMCNGIPESVGQKRGGNVGSKGNSAYSDRA